MKKPTKKMMALRARIHNQEEWIKQCGGTFTGYLANYGAESALDIYCADMSALVDLIDKLEKCS